MMYTNKLVSCIKVGGKVLRENGDTVRLPFGSEYSVFIKNMENRRVVAEVLIDDQPVCEGGFLVGANQSIDIERFVSDLNKGNRFKFIERTAAVEAHRGIGASDGIIQIRCRFEQMPVVTTTFPSYPGLGINCSSGAGGMLTNSLGGGAFYSAQMTPTMDSWSDDVSAVANEAGITVPGSISEQKYHVVTTPNLETATHVMVFRLVGGEAIKEAITVKTKPRCISCGRQNKSTAKFCTECGTGLELVA